MTWRRATPVILLGVLFDLIRLMFEWFVIAGPAIGAALCTYLVSSDNTFATALGGASCATGATAIGILAAPAIETFGVIMAMAVGLIGWLTVGIILLKTNRRIFAENFVWFLTSLLVSEVPLVGSVPAITLILVKMYRTQIQHERSERKAFEAAQAAEARARERQALLELQAMDREQAANDEEYLEEFQEAANDDEYVRRESA